MMDTNDQPMKTEADIQELKRQWMEDPNWDIEDTEGFEEYKEELHKFRIQKEKEWERERKCFLIDKSVEYGIPGNLELTQRLLTMEDRISLLTEQLMRITVLEMKVADQENEICHLRAIHGIFE